MKAVETTGHMDQPGLLRLDTKINFDKTKLLKIIILIQEEDEISNSVWLESISLNPAFDFLKDAKEDIYTSTDGKLFKL